MSFGSWRQFEKRASKKLLNSRFPDHCCTCPPWEPGSKRRFLGFPSKTHSGGADEAKKLPPPNAARGGWPNSMLLRQNWQAMPGRLLKNPAFSSTVDFDGRAIRAQVQIDSCTAHGSWTG